MAVGVLYRVLHLLLKTQWRPVACFAHDASRQGQTHRKMFGDNVRFNGGFNGMVCRTRDLDSAIPSSDAAFARYARQYLEALLAQPGASTSDKVRELVRLQLASGRCVADHLAEQLGMDRRALHPRLAREQQTYSAIVEEVRTEIAARRPPSRQQSLGSIAGLTGFASLSAFSRWFSGRVGVSPMTWRLSSSIVRQPAR